MSEKSDYGIRYELLELSQIDSRQACALCKERLDKPIDLRQSRCAQVAQRAP